MRAFGSPSGRTTCCEKNNRNVVRVGQKWTSSNSTPEQCPLKVMVKILLVCGAGRPVAGFPVLLQEGIQWGRAFREDPGVRHLLEALHMSLLALLLAPMKPVLGGREKGEGWRQLVWDK